MGDKSRLAAVLGQLLMGAATWAVVQANLTPTQTMVAALVIGGAAILLVPSLRKAVSESDGQLQSILGLLAVAGADWAVLEGLPLAGAAEGPLAGFLVTVLGLAFPAIHTHNAPAPSGP